MRGLSLQPSVSRLPIGSHLALIDSCRTILDYPRDHIVIARDLHPDPGLQRQLYGPDLALDGLNSPLDYSIRARTAGRDASGIVPPWEGPTD